MKFASSNLYHIPIMEMAMKDRPWHLYREPIEPVEPGNVLLTSREPRCWLAGVEAGGREEFIPTFTSPAQPSPAQPSPVVTQTLTKQVPVIAAVSWPPPNIIYIGKYSPAEQLHDLTAPM